MVDRAVAGLHGTGPLGSGKCAAGGHPRLDEARCNGSDVDVRRVRAQWGPALRKFDPHRGFEPASYLRSSEPIAAVSRHHLPGASDQLEAKGDKERHRHALDDDLGLDK